MNPETIKLMRDWVKECIWGDIEHEHEVDALDDSEVLRGIERHYDGGVAAFLRDCQAPAVVPVVEHCHCEVCGALIVRQGVCSVCSATLQSVDKVTPVSVRVVVQDELVLNPEDLR